MLRKLARRIFSGGYSSSHPTLQGDVDVMGAGSENVLATGTGRTRIWKGVKLHASDPFGGLVMMNVGDTYGGLGTLGDSNAIGSIFRVLGSIFFIGQGTLSYNGSDTGGDATTTLSLKTIASGSLSSTYQAGSAEPSAPTVTVVDPPTGYTGKNNGVVSVKIARVRSTTGAESNASPTSAIVAPSNQSVAVTFPSADSNGQDYWAVYGTKNAEGGLGNHYFVQEIAESTLTETVVANATTDSDTTITLPNGTLTSTHIGWQYTSAGDTTTYVTAVGADGSGGGSNQLITLAAASVLSTTQSATFTRAVDGTLRTYVFEWRDSDLDPILAPIRNFPPPAAVFGGSIEDVVFIDGCYGDTANVIGKSTGTASGLLDNTYSTANTGNAIAVSDPLKPESFPPDNYLFTGDAPTCLLAGSNGVYWRFAKNSLGVIRYIGGSPALSYERIWTGVGVQKQHNACLGQGGRLYAYTADRGIVRMGANGEPDTLFAARVADDTASWTASNVVLGFDGDNQMVCFMHDDDILAYYEPLDLWCAPLVIDEDVTTTGTIKSAVTVDGQLYIGWIEATGVSVYNFDVADATYKTTGKVVTPWIAADEVSMAIHRIMIAMRCDTTGNDVTIKIYANGSGTARRTFTITPASTGAIYLPVLKPSVTNAKMFRVEISYQHNGGDAGFDLIDVEGVDERITW